MTGMRIMDRDRFLKSVAFAGLSASPAGALARYGTLHNNVSQTGHLDFYWLTLGDPRTVKAFQSLLDKFQRTYPGLTVEQTTPPHGSSYIQKFEALVAAGIPPDLSDTGMDQYWAADRGIFVNLKPFIERDHIPFSDIYPLAARSFYDKAKNLQYGIPHSMNSMVVYYNKTLFDRAKVPYPPHSWNDPTWTWDAYLQRAKALTIHKKGGSLPTQFGSMDLSGAMFYTAPYMFGGNWVNKNQTAFVVDKPAAVRGFQYCQDLYNKYKVAPSPSQTELAAAGFLSGKVAMTIDGTWAIAAYRDITRFKWDVAPMPFARELGPKAPRSNPIFPDGFVMSSKNYQDASWELLKFVLYNKTNYETWSRNVVDMFPAQRSMTKNFLAWARHTLPIRWEVMTDSWDRGSYVWMFMNRHYSQIQNLTTSNIWQPLAAGNQSAQQIITSALPQLNQVLQS